MLESSPQPSARLLIGIIMTYDTMVLKLNLARNLWWLCIISGVRPVDFVGNFYMSNTTDVEMAVVDCEKAFCCEIKHDDKLSDGDGVYIQVLSQCIWTLTVIFVVFDVVVRCGASPGLVSQQLRRTCPLLVVLYFERICLLTSSGAGQRMVFFN